VIRFLLICHGLCAVALLGAITHQAAAVWIPVTKGSASFFTRFRAVKAAGYVNAVITLFLITFVIGSIIYPTYRVGARIFMEELRMGPQVGSFEVKEHLISFGLALLPAYWYYWRLPHDPADTGARKGIVLLLAGFIWFAFLTGHVLNNIKGL
jgi:hypothetical protein